MEWSHVALDTPREESSSAILLVYWSVSQVIYIQYMRRLQYAVSRHAEYSFRIVHRS